MPLRNVSRDVDTDYSRLGLKRQVRIPMIVHFWTEIKEQVVVNCPAINPNVGQAHPFFSRLLN